MPHRFKAFHRPFALSGGLMRVLGAIVEIPRLPVGHRPHKLAVSNPIAGQFVGHQGTVNLSNPRAIFAGAPPRFTRSRVTYEAYVVSRTSTRPQVDSAVWTTAVPAVW